MSVRLLRHRMPEPAPAERSPAFDENALLHIFAPNDPTDFDDVRPSARGAVGDAERRLMGDVLFQAVYESRSRANARSLRPADRDAARTWLRGEPGFSARECCEALGVDYEAMLKRLEKEWR